MGALHDLGDGYLGVEMDPDVCGGEARIVRTRIPVWVLERARRLGVGEAELLRSYPTLRAEDLANAWAYARAPRGDGPRYRGERGGVAVARLYANENFPLTAAYEFRRPGHDVLTTRDAGMAGVSMTDEHVLRFASEDNRAVLALNREHLVRLHAERRGHGGIIVCTFDFDFTRQARRVHAAIEDCTDLSG